MEKESMNKQNKNGVIKNLVISIKEPKKLELEEELKRR